MPIGSFRYEPGVQSTAAQSFQQSNVLLGQALIGLFDRLGEAKTRQAAKVEQQTHEGRMADAWMKSVVAGAGDDDSAVTKTLGMDSKAFALLGAAEKADRMKGAIAGEQFTQALTTFKSQQDKAKTDAAGEALLPALLTKAQDLGEQATYNGFTGQQNPAAPMPALIFKALKTFTPEQQSTIARSAKGGQLLQSAMSGAQRDDLQTSREAEITSRAREGYVAKSDLQAQKDDRLDARQQNKLDFADKALAAHMDLGRQRLAGKGKITGEQLLKSNESTRTALIKAQGVAEAFKNEDAVAKYTKQLAELDTERDALIAENGRPRTAAAAALPTVTHQAGYDKLSKGAQYIGPDGKTYTKK